jgi:hypothetical protein
MNPSLIIKYFLSFLLLVVLQITIFFHTSIFSVAFCYIYIAFVVFLPLSLNRSWMMSLALIMGLTIDLFYNTLGINAFAAVTVAFFRNKIFYLFLSSSDVDENSPISMANMGVGVFISYTLSILLIHNLLVFFLQNWDNGNLFFVFYSSIFSALLTLFIIVMGELLFFKERR